MVKYNGKNHFIGCSGWHQNHPARTHCWIPIPDNVDEDILLKVFKNKGQLNLSELKGIQSNLSAECAYVALPCHAGQGKWECCKFITTTLCKILTRFISLPA